MLKKIIWIAVLIALGIGLWKAGLYFYRAMEQEEEARHEMMDKQSQSTAESITAPATSGMEHKANQVRKKIEDIEREEQE